MHCEACGVLYEPENCGSVNRFAAWVILFSSWLKLKPGGPGSGEEADFATSS